MITSYMHEGNNPQDTHFYGREHKNAIIAHATYTSLQNWHFEEMDEEIFSKWYWHGYRVHNVWLKEQYDMTGYTVELMIETGFIYYPQFDCMPDILNYENSTDEEHYE